MKKRWNILPWQDMQIQALQKELNIHPVLCKILSQRGIHSFETAKDFFRPQLNMMHSPWLMKDMHLAVTRIQEAINGQERILIFGDYDVDGTTSVACMYLFLQTQYPNIDFYIPHRYKEGYGISRAGIDYAHEHGFSLIISLDCGIKSIELIAYAKTIGIDFIVCDHHLPDEELPPAIAILNPKQKDCAYPYKELCGCGVGLKLIQAICNKLQLPDSCWQSYLDLVTVAIAADIVPITGENRVIAFYGLKKVNENPAQSIKALLFLSGQKDIVHINSLVFVVAPRINAAGRMDDARKAVDLFLETDYEKALIKAELLQADNTDRRETDASITEEALALLEQEDAGIVRHSTVVYKEHWHKGVVGIVASRLIETYYRPTVVLTKSGSYASGSARSVTGFNLYEAIHACRQHLIGYGGHFAAAGLTLEIESIPAFIHAFEKVVTDTIDPELLIPEIIIDSAVTFRDITMGFYNVISQMEPFGPGNMRPVFITEKVRETGYSSIVKEKHIRFIWQQDELTFSGIGFGMYEKFPLLQKDKLYDIVYTLDLNEWKETKTLQMRMIDFKLSGSLV